MAFRNSLIDSTAKIRRTTDVLTRNLYDAYAFQYSFTLLTVSILMSNLEHEHKEFEHFGSNFNIAAGGINLIVLTDLLGLRLIPFGLQEWILDRPEGSFISKYYATMFLNLVR